MYERDTIWTSANCIYTYKINQLLSFVLMLLNFKLWYEVTKK